MKKLLILTSVCLLAYQASHAQTEKGDQTLGVNLGFGYSKSNEFDINSSDGSTGTSNGKTTSFNIGPNYSYFIADKLDLGTSLQYNSAVTNSTPDIFNDLMKQVNRYYGASVYLRKYFMYSDKIGIRTGPYVAYYRQDTQNNYNDVNAISDYNSKSDNYEAGVNLDLVYYPSKCLGISASLANLQYIHSKTNNGTQGHSSNDDVNFSYINNGLGFSVFYVFGAK
jgi:hypothetical protein